MKTFQQIREDISQHPMIDVDGVMKHRNNSEGKPIHHTDEGIRNFHRWFGDSKAVDEHGRPKVVYHGSHSDFHSFSKAGMKWFSHKPDLASAYAKTVRPDSNAHPNVLASYVRTKNPITLRGDMNDVTKPHEVFRSGEGFSVHAGMDASPRKMFRIVNDKHFVQSALKAGHDAFFAREAGRITVGVMHPHQIKSATGNNGKFSSSDNLSESNIYE